MEMGKCFRVIGCGHKVSIGLLWMLAWGCHGAMPSASESPAERLEHVRPAHMPADFPAAVRRLVRLHEEICQEVPPRPAGELSRLDELRDIIRWLPELAGDSDMPEAGWNIVQDASQKMQEAFPPTPTAWDEKAFHRELVRLLRSRELATEFAEGRPTSNALDPNNSFN